MADDNADKWDGGDAEMEAVARSLKDSLENPELPSLAETYQTLNDCENEARAAGNEAALAEIEATRSDPGKLKAFRVKLAALARADSGNAK